jgi:aspartyl-tRNA(Asn)/glutamyl-tRNA(Gln) amidotransferase subunit C
MAVTLEDVRYVAQLARLSFTAEEEKTLVHDLNAILDYMEQLGRLETSNIEPLTHVLDHGNVLRDDVLIPSLPRDEVLRNAPARTEEFFRVPKVIGDR